jgi:hypothetical protein
LTVDVNFVILFANEELFNDAVDDEEILASFNVEAMDNSAEGDLLAIDVVNSGDKQRLS